METDLPGLKRKIVFSLVLYSIILFLLLFIPAGSLAFLEGWICYVIFIGSSLFITTYFYRRSPELIERRMRRKEGLREQKVIQIINTILFIAGFVIAGLDHRFNWSRVPLNIALLGDVMVLCGYLIVFLVLTQNAYASAIIEVEKDQRVVSTGLYAIIRHPMYFGAMIMILFTPVALGSLWALIPFAIMPCTIILRLLNEEKLLLKELAGYEEYCKKVRYRLIPYVW
jgi:protein-S-isoprenylcysteine O-methyltransferase Ste14